MDGCIFCMIAEGRMDAKVVYADDEFIAFDDIMPQAPVHTLVIPRKHHATLHDGVPADVLGRLFRVVTEVADAKELTEAGYRVIVNNGPASGQTVGHVHVHVLGGARMTHGMVRLEAGPAGAEE